MCGGVERICLYVYWFWVHVGGGVWGVSVVGGGAR